MASEIQFDSEVVESIPSLDAVDQNLRFQCQLASIDASETLVFARQMETISNKVFRIQYPELKAASLIPMNNEAGPADEYLTFRVWDAYTMAKIVGNYSTDIPLVNASAREVTTKFFTVANGYTYSVDDLRQSQRAGTQLQSRFAEAARRGIELAREEVAAVGSAEVGTYGLANQPNVTLSSLPNGDWANAATTGEEINADLNFLVDTMVLGTNEILSPDTIVLPTSLFRIAAKKLISVGGVVGGMSALDLFRSQNPGIAIISWNKLETAGATGGKRIIAYKRSSDVLEFLNAVALETMPTEYHHMQWTTVLRSRMGGVALYQPKGVIYSDAAGA